ncbi:unnamed protein product [Rotaria magnacalcarata]|uniref:Gamma-secretase subunit PEN-2 n=1 Tax=Rotaria magnacalcarata TaxID=392030 RepID=A0A8S3HUG7_9BILA|nr:unnamed protein product [Rotaria magnacalcarata]CAF5189193.1 unnamed protein product [Rotaria magnacalcarata]
MFTYPTNLKFEADNGCQFTLAINSYYEERISTETEEKWFRGFAFLPLLWLINFIWFFRQAFKVEPYPQQAEIRKYVIRSAIGTFIWCIIIIAWNIIFQQLRTRLGPAGDYLTFVVPRGYY